MTAIDTNVLVALAIQDHPRHAGARAVFQNILRSGGEIALNSSILAEFLHTVTDQRRFQSSRGMPAAVAWFREWSFRRAPKWLSESEASINLWLRWMDQFQLGRKRILDTRYAAVLHACNVRRLMTANPDDFEIFDVFELVTF